MSTIQISISCRQSPVYRLREALHFSVLRQRQGLADGHGIAKWESRSRSYAGPSRTGWRATGQTSIPLIVVHSHPHDDHTAGDAEVQAMHDPAMPVEFVPAELEATKRFWGIEHWPTDIGHVDLGGR